MKTTNWSQCFTVVHEYGLKVNPEKCFFAVQSGKFLGYYVSERGTFGALHCNFALCLKHGPCLDGRRKSSTGNYYIGKVFNDAETRYTTLDKFMLALWLSVPFLRDAFFKD